MYFFNYSTQSLHLGWPLAIAGIFLIARCSRRANGGQFKGWNLLSLLLFMYIFYMVVFHILSNLPIEQALFFGVHIRFWMQPNAITAIFVGVGMLCAGPLILLPPLLLLLLYSSCLLYHHSISSHDSPLQFRAPAGLK